MKDEYRRILEATDEAGSFEFPSKFDYLALECRAKEVQARIQKELGEPTRFEGMQFNQDASFSIAIIFETRAILKGKLKFEPSIRFSNFGDLVTTCWHELLPEQLYHRAVRILEAEGFHFIPEEVLKDNYDGVMVGKFPNWWGRYFDWI